MAEDLGRKLLGEVEEVGFDEVSGGLVTSGLGNFGLC